MYILLLLPIIFAAVFAGQASAAEVRPDHLLVGFREDVSRSTEKNVLEDAGTDPVRQLRSIDVALVQIEEGTNRSAAVRELRQSGAVEFIEADYRVEAAATPSDTFFSNMWGLHNTGQTVQSVTGTPDADIDAPEAWDLETGAGGDVVVGIADTGIDLQHGDLAPNLWKNPGEIAGNGIDDDGNGKTDDTVGWNWVSGSANPDDDNYHGTHVAGTVAARGNNSKGVAGVSWGARLAALKVLDSGGSGWTSDVAASAVYAGQMGFDVYNASLGGGSFSQTFLTVLQAYPDTLYVFAAGNEGQNIESTKYYPCSYNVSNVLCVASTNSVDGLSSFSNYGASEVDLAAPGSSILSTYPQSTAGVDQYAYLSGTSMATPHVAGAAALLRQAVPGSSVARLRSWLLSSTNPLPALSGKVASGGRLNLLAALELALASEENSPPSLQIVSGERAWINTTSPSWQFQATRADSVECSLQAEGQAATWGPCTTSSSYSASGLAHGSSYTFQVRATNSAGSAIKSSSFSVDTVAPAAPAILSGPPAAGQSRNVLFTLRGESSGTFSCSVDLGSPAWVPCSGGNESGLSSHQRTNMNDGEYTFRVRQEDQAGNLSSVATSSFVIDNVAPPAPTATASPPLWSSSRSATVSFVHEGSAQCSLDGAPFADCSSPWSRSELAQGEHILLVRARDAAGNQSTGNLSVVWNVDTVAPAAPLISGPSGTTAFRNISFAFSGEAGASYLCGLETLEPCAGSVSYQNMPAGPYTLSVRQADRAGNLSPLQERTFTVGEEGPELSLGTLPPSPSSDRRPLFAWALSNSEYSVLCSIDRGTPTWQACSGPSSHRPDADLGEGQHTFRVRVSDPQGSWLQRQYSFEIDTTAPSLTFSGTSGLRNTREAVVGFATGESSTFRCSLDGAALADCSSPWSGSGLADGLRTLRVEARDLAGNTRAQDFVWTIDASPPPRPTLQQLSENSVAIESEAESTLECQLNNEDWQPCSSPWSRPLPDGNYILRARAQDVAGNISKTGTISWQVGLLPPGVEGPDAQGRIWFSGGDEYLCAWSKEEMRVCPNPYPVDSWTNGTYSYRVQIREDGRLSATTEGSFQITDAPAPPDTGTYVSPGTSGWTASRNIRAQISWPMGSRFFVAAEQSAPLQRNTTIQIPAAAGSGRIDIPVAFTGWGGAVLWESSVSVFRDVSAPRVSRARMKKLSRGFLIRLRASDEHSGLGHMEWSYSRRSPRPAGSQVIGSDMKVQSRSRAPRWIRVSDRTGNWSNWQKPN